MKRVIVIGAGVAGLAAAARLQHAGYEVTLFEKEPLVGGKMNQIREEGFTFDVGPTIVMMPELYREVFETCGRNADDYIPMEKVEPLMDISFGPGDRLRLSNDLASMTAAVEAVGEKDAQGYFEYLALLYKRYLIAKDNFLQRSFRKPIDFYNPKSLVAGLRLHTLGDAYSSVAHHVKDDRLRKALAFQTLYIGISPFEGPSLYMIIPMIELLYGVWFMKGGMYAMAQAMGRLFLEQGGELRTSTPVERIVVENGCACGVEAGGTVHYADSVSYTHLHEVQGFAGVAAEHDLARIGGADETRDVGAGLVDGLGGVHRQAIKAAQGVRVHLLVEAALRVEGDGRALGRGCAVEEGEAGVGRQQGEVLLVGVRGYVDAHATASSISMPRAAARRVTDARVRWSGALMAASSKEAVMNKRSASSGEMPRLAR